MKRTLFLFLISSLITISSCKKKYDEGPFISFKSWEERIQGVWELNYYTEDGVSSLGDYEDYYSGGCTFDFKKWDDTTRNVFYITWGSPQSPWYNYLTTVVFYKGVEDAYLDVTGTLSDGYSWYSFDQFSADAEWKILKLKYDTVWMKITYQDKVYELHLANKSKY